MKQLGLAKLITNAFHRIHSTLQLDSCDYAFLSADRRCIIQNIISKQL